MLVKVYMLVLSRALVSCQLAQMKADVEVASGDFQRRLEQTNTEH